MFRKFTAMFILSMAVPALLVAHSGSHNKTMGTVSKVEVSKIHVKTLQGRDQDVPVTQKTTFVRSGKPASIKDVAAGTRVVIDLTTAGAAEKVTIGKTGTPPKD